MLWIAHSVVPEFCIDDYLAGLESDLLSFGLHNYQHFETREIECAMNWKLVVDTFLESYHIDVLHRDTISPIIHANVGAFDAFGKNYRGVHARRTIDRLRDLPESEWDLIRHTAMVYVLFPNTVFVMQGDHLETWRVFPAGKTNHSRMAVSLYTPEPVVSDKAAAYWARNMALLLDTVQQEDFPVGENIQRGFSSGAQTHISYGRNEPALGHFHASIAAALA